MNADDIKKTLLAISPDLFPKHGVDLAYLFGSANAGRYGPRSDIDIAVRFEKERPATDYFRLVTPIEIALRKELAGKIDLAILNIASPLLRYEVVKNGLILYAKDDERLALFHIRVYRDYEDFCHAQDFYIRAMKKRLGVSG